MVQLTFLQQHNPRKAIVQVPEVHRRHTALVVQLSVDIKRLIGLDLHLAHPLTGNSALTRTFTATRTYTASAALVQRGIKLVAPWRAVRVAVAVVVAEEVVATRLLAALYCERLVHGGEEVFGEIWGEGDKGVEVVGGVFGIETAEEVAVMISRGCRKGT
jgi:hypothetical protein